MKMSVVTVSYNTAATIGYTLESFLLQDHPDKELLVIDGASKDDTLRVVERFGSDQIRVVCEPDTGLYDAMNKGLGLFTGDAVGFLNADDRYNDARVLSDIAAGLCDVDIVYGDLDFVADHQDSAVVRTWRGTPWRKGSFRRGWMPAHPTFYVRRGVVETVGRFDTSLRIAADYDYMLRAMELGDFRSRLLSRTMVQMMTGGASTSGLRGYLKSNLEALRARRRWLGSGIIDTALLAKPLGKIGQFIARSPSSRPSRNA
jgi:glycosyltransferase involved in cell wall biosynthesis